jgi:hypothetical protein
VAIVCCLLVLAAGLTAAQSADAQQPVAAAPAVVDGPSADVDGLGGMSVARDGTGGLVYLKQVDGVAHVFVSRLVGGAFLAPEQADVGLPGPSSEPVIAAGNGGVVLVAFINGGELFVNDRLSATGSPSGPLQLASGASSPAISISNFGKAYLAFAVAGTGGDDVRAAYYYAGRWAAPPTPLDANPADDAGSGTGRPAVIAAGDGVGIVTWGEAGHVYTRRVWGTAPSTVFEQADPPSLGGWNELAADQPEISAGGDSSFAIVAFHEVLSDGAQTQSRVLVRRLHGSVYDPLLNGDGLATPGPSGAGTPAAIVTEYGSGFVTSARTDTNALAAMTIGSGESAGPVNRVDSLPNASPPDAVAASAGIYSTMIAWQRDPGTPFMPEIRLRFAPDGTSLGPEEVLSSPALGPTDADLGLVAAGDVSGDAVVAWVQGPPGARAIVTDQLYQRPGSLAPAKLFRYARSSRPVLAWSAARELWGPMRYTVTLDGAPLPPSTATALVPPAPLTDGRHTWQVTATNPVGLTSTARAAGVWVDTVPPAGSVTITGRKRIGAVLHLQVTYTDAPPPELPVDASGIARVTVNWGDGSVYRIKHGKYHAYIRTGRYRVTVTITDRAGNVTKLVQRIRITPKPKPKPKHKRRPRH